MVSDPATDRAAKLYKSCVFRALHKGRQAMYKKVDTIATPESTAIMNRFGATVVAGHLGSLLVGTAIARYLARPGSSLKYPPGLLGQIMIATGIGFLGGCAISYRATLSTLPNLLETDSGISKVYCTMLNELKPCVDDPDCNQIMRVGSKNMLRWYEVCNRKKTMMHTDEPVFEESSDDKRDEWVQNERFFREDSIEDDDPWREKK